MRRIDERGICRDVSVQSGLIGATAGVGRTGGAENVVRRQSLRLSVFTVDGRPWRRRDDVVEKVVERVPEDVGKPG
jgi:hypothetical protein